MKNKKYWIDLCILNLCVVAMLGVTLRSKILFYMPFIDYDHLLDAHSHFAFGGWVTLALMVLMVYYLLPVSSAERPIYYWLFAGITITSWVMLFGYAFGATSMLSDLFSTLFILVTYFFSWRFIKDILHAPLSRSVKLSAISSVACLVISSIGPFTLAYLFASKSLNLILYKDALYTYLHFQYNGFFTLSVFSLLFQKSEMLKTPESDRAVYRFSMLLIISLVPSLFLTFLWQNPGIVFRIIAITGSALLLVCLFLFFNVLVHLRRLKKTISPVIKWLVLFSLSAFTIKLFLQSLTIFPPIGIAVFGDRPIIIGFLHLVFLGFVTLFIIAFFSQEGFLNLEHKLTRIALTVFTAAVVLNELLLMTQGLGAMFIKSSYLFPSLLWVASITLLIGALLIAASRIQTKSKTVTN